MKNNQQYTGEKGVQGKSEKLAVQSGKNCE